MRWGDSELRVKREIDGAVLRARNRSSDRMATALTRRTETVLGQHWSHRLNLLHTYRKRDYPSQRTSSTWRVRKNGILLRGVLYNLWECGGLGGDAAEQGGWFGFSSE